MKGERRPSQCASYALSLPFRRTESRNDFIHKVGLVEKEAAESQFWLELFDEVKIGDETERAWLLNEATELLAIFTSIGKTAKARRDA